MLYNISSFYIQNFKPLSSLYCWAGRFESYLVATPENNFSHVVAPTDVGQGQETVREATM